MSAENTRPGLDPGPRSTRPRGAPGRARGGVKSIPRPGLDPGPRFSGQNAAPARAPIGADP